MMEAPAKISALTAAALAASMTFIDTTALNQALPAIGDAIDASAPELLWVVGAYAAALALLLLPAGVVADRAGRRATLAGGIVVFASASVGCAAASDVKWMIAARVVQGIGGAAMVTGSLAVLTSVYPAPQRGRAIGAWSAWSAAATIAGPLLGGVLAEAGMWRLIFLINLPLALVALMALRRVRVVHDETSHAETMRTPLWRRAVVRVTVALTLVLDTALYGLLLVLPLALIAGAGYRADHAAAAQLALVLLLVAVCPVAGRWVDRRGPRVPVCAGCSLAALGLLWLAAAGLGDGPADYVLRLLGPLALIGAGMGMGIVALSTTMMNGVGEHALGAGAALNALVARGASVLATALFGGLLLQQGVDFSGRAASPTSWHQTFPIAMGLAALLCLASAAYAALVLRSQSAVDAAESDVIAQSVEARP